MSLKGDILAFRRCKTHSLYINERILSVTVFSLFFSWLLAFPFEGRVLYALAQYYGTDAHALVFCAMASHFIGLVACGFFIKTIKHAQTLMQLSIVLCIVGSTAFFFTPSIMWVISLLIMSFFSGGCVAAWGFYLKRYTPSKRRIKTIADGLICCNILMIIINMTAIYISAYAGLGLSIFMLAAALLFTTFFTSENMRDTQPETHKLTNKVSLIKPLVFLCLFIVVITIDSGLMYQVVNPAFEHHQWLVSWYWAVPYIAALYIARNLSGRVNNTYMLYAAIAMIGFSFIGFMLFNRSVPSYLFVNTLMLSACGIHDLFWWRILAEMLDFSNNPAKVFGIGLSCNVLGVLTGGIIGNTIASTASQVHNSAVLGFAVVFATVIILPVLHKQLFVLLKNHALFIELSEMPSNKKEQAIDNFMAISGLTQRESEVAALLLRGRTYKMIAAELYLSENTVKTHIKNIYAKFNIQSKTQLVRLLMDKRYVSTDV